MAIDFAADFADIVDSGDLPEVTGTLAQGGTDYAFTGGLVTGRRRAPAGGTADMEEISLLLSATGVATTPVVDGRVEFTDDDPAAGSWVVIEAEPIAPGGTAVAWRLTLRNWTGR